MANRNPYNRSHDPYVYASILNQMMVNRNPIQAIAGDLARMIKVLANLNKNRQLAQQRIDALESRVREIEGQMAMVNPKTHGIRLDKMR